jgi:hypothetical protein
MFSSRITGAIALVWAGGLICGAAPATAGWGPTVTIGAATGADSYGPALGGGGGSLAIGWTDRAFHQRVAVRSPGRALHTTRLRGLPFTCDRPEVTVGPGGDVAVAWLQRGPRLPLRCSLFAATAGPGRALGRMQRLSTPGEQTYNPSLAVGQGGTAAVSWTGDDYVQAAVAPRGGPFGREENASRFESSYYSAAGVDSQNRAVVLWTVGGRDVGKLRRARRAKRGGFGKPVTIVSPPPGFRGYPFSDWTARFDAAGRPIVLWTPAPDEGPSELVALVGSDRRVLEPGTSSGSDNGSLAVAPNGTALAAWTVTDAGGHSSLHASLRRPGGVFGAPFAVPGSEGALDPPAAAVDNAGLGAIAWWDKTGVRAAAVLHGNQLSPPRPLAAAGHAPSAATDGAGHAVVAWETDKAVQMATFTGGTP